MNNTVISGNVGRDPEVKVFESGSVKVTFSLAVYAGKKNGEVQTAWHNCEAWGKVGESIADHVRKGDRLLICGSSKIDTYEKDGQKRTNNSINVMEYGITPRSNGASPNKPDDYDDIVF